MKLTAKDLEDIRNYYAISQSQLAEKLGISQSYVAHMERNARPIPAYVADKLEITPERLEAIRSAAYEREKFINEK